MRHQIDEDGAIPMASPLRPLVHREGLQGWGAGPQGRPYQPDEGSRRVGSRRRAASRAPAFPLRATSMACRTATSRQVFRAYVATRPGRRSEKMRRTQVGLRQMNLRTKSCMRTARGPYGRSVTWR